jgi:hypothetical protein
MVHQVTTDPTRPVVSSTEEPGADTLVDPLEGGLGDELEGVARVVTPEPKVTGGGGDDPDGGGPVKHALVTDGAAWLREPVTSDKGFRLRYDKSGVVPKGIYVTWVTSQQAVSVRNGQDVGRAYEAVKVTYVVGGTVHEGWTKASNLKALSDAE